MTRRKFVAILLVLSAPVLILLRHADPIPKRHGKRTSTGNFLSHLPGVPLKAMPVISAALGRDDARYEIISTDAGLRALNPGQDLAARFTSLAVTVSSGRSSMQVYLSAYGRKGAAMHPVRPVAPRGNRNRVEYRRGLLTEWYVNGPLGLEQGFTVNSPPEATNAGELELALKFSGDMIATAAPDGEAILFSDAAGKTKIRYYNLLAQDASGKSLPAHMDLRGDRLLLAVNDTGARYPIIVDPTYGQMGVITATSAPAGSFLGAGSFNPGGIAIDAANETIVAAAQGQGDSQLPGFAYVFVSQGTGWIQATQLLNSDNTVASVAISGDSNTIVVGSCGLNNCTGHAFVYVKTGAFGWNTSANTFPIATLSAPGAKNGDRVGFSVATDFSGDTIAFGSPCDFTAGITQCGSVDVFVIPSSGNWSDDSSATQPTAVLTLNLLSGPQLDGLGVSVGMDQNGDTIVAGAIGVKGAPNEDGTATVFVRPGSAITSWTSTSTPSATLVQGIGLSGDWFGFSSAIDQNGDTIVVGAPFARINCGSNCSPLGPGAAYVFLKPATLGGWKDDGATGSSVSENAMLTASDGNPSDAFGTSVSIDGAGDTIIVGSPSNPVQNSLVGPGAAYVFGMPSGGWSGFPLNEDLKLAALAQQDFNGNQVVPKHGFAGSLFISSDASLITVGNSEATVGSNNNQGAIFLFRPSACAVLTPTSGAFNNIPDFTSSQPLQFVLTNFCTTTLTNVIPAVSGPNASDFSLTNTCGTSLAGNSSCDLNVIFTPSIPASPIIENATLSVSDLDSSSPQTASLTGSDVVSNADFTLAPTSASPASTGSNCTPPSDTNGSCSATVIQGNKATYTLQLAAANGFNLPVDVIVTGLPANATCGNFVDCLQTVSPTSTGAQVTIVVATNGSSEALSRVPAVGAAAFGAPWAPGRSIPAFIVFGVLFGRKLRRSRQWLQFSALAVIVITFGGWGGCNHHGTTTPSCSTGTVFPGTYTFTVEGANHFGGAPNHFATLTLVVQPCPSK